MQVLFFDDDVACVQDWTTDRDAVVEAIQRLQPNGKTALCDAIEAGHAQPGRAPGRAPASPVYRRQGHLLEIHRDASAPCRTIAAGGNPKFRDWIEESGTGRKHAFRAGQSLRGGRCSTRPRRGLHVRPTTSRARDVSLHPAAAIHPVGAGCHPSHGGRELMGMTNHTAAMHPGDVIHECIAANIPGSQDTAFRKRVSSQERSARCRIRLSFGVREDSGARIQTNFAKDDQDTARNAVFLVRNEPTAASSVWPGGGNELFAAGNGSTAGGNERSVAGNEPSDPRNVLAARGNVSFNPRLEVADRALERSDPPFGSSDRRNERSDAPFELAERGNESSERALEVFVPPFESFDPP